MKITHIILLFTLIISSSCDMASQPSESSSLSSSSQLSDLSERDKSVLNSANLFGFEIFKKIINSEDKDKNVFVSPLSISIALTMTENGTAGATLDSIKSVLKQYNYSMEEINQSCKDLEHILENADDDIIMNIANSIWPRINKEIEPNFIDICKNYFDADVKKMDWSIAESADTVNNWVKEKTNGLIEKMVDKPVSMDVAMLLINTIYFKGFWTVVFDSTKTSTSSFTKYDNSVVTCDFMKKYSDDDSTLLYYENDSYQTASIPYGHGNFYMTVLLPKEGNSTDDLLSELESEKWENLLENLEHKEFNFYMPKYKFKYEKSLQEILTEMGMGIAFNNNLADFSNMFIDNEGWISKVKHKTFIQTDENGTEAAAATVVEVIDSVAPVVPTINLNRPYLFVIHEKVSKSILFMGRLSEPVWE